MLKIDLKKWNKEVFGSLEPWRRGRQGYVQVGENRSRKGTISER